MSVFPQTLNQRARQSTVMEKGVQCFPVTYALYTSLYQTKTEMEKGKPRR